MPRPFCLLAVATIAAFCLLLWLVLLVRPVAAHEWLSGKSDPSTGQSCCNDSDCKPEPIGGVVPVEGGFLIVATGEVFPADRTQWSPDGRFWRCQFPSDKQARCLFIPPLGS